MSTTKKAAFAEEILQRLGERYPDPKPALRHTSPWELLVATVLSAQCTDERVNMVTPEFFRRWPGPEELAQAELPAIEEVVRSTGFFRNKAKNLKAAAVKLMAEYGGELPRTMAEMVKLPGAARKTANIVLSNAFGVHEGVAVDTHVKRLSNRLGLVKSDNPAVIERELMALIPQQDWGRINHLLVFFGRDTCQARKPNCPACVLADICPKIGVADK
ncbi:MAG: endonuclease [Desulfovibrionales bacterium]|jgi:endonuclease-3|nr:endonuclease [Desulfovibrionales bacterium]